MGNIIRGHTVMMSTKNIVIHNIVTPYPIHPQK